MNTDDTALARLAPEGEVPVPRDSATVIVARDGASGIEVFMLERHIKSDFLGGAYVFPGGGVDDADCDPALHGLIDGPSPAEAAARVEAAPGRELGFHLAAIRETFEEAGVLLASHPDGTPVRLDGAEEGRFAAARRALIAREIALADLAEREGIRYSLDRLHYFSRWITPEGVHRRYDARFFVAVMPEGQTPLHDAVETTASMWVRPQDALDRARAGELTIIFPTRKTLEAVAAFDSVASLVASTRDKEVRAILPKIVLQDGSPRVFIDGAYHEP